MIHQISGKITDKFIDLEIIKPEDKELYTYGLSQGIVIALNIATTILFGLAFRMLWQSIILMTAYIPLRIYAGGYHAKTQLRCYLFSIILIGATLLGIKFIPWSNLISLFLLITAGSVIFLLAPVESSNKPLDSKEKIVYRNLSRTILIVLTCLDLLFIAFGLVDLSVVITAAITILAFMLLIGKLSGTRNS